MYKSSLSTTMFASLQWLFFMFANIVVVPLSIGTVFHLSPEDIVATLRSSFIFTGIACVLQALLGHRYPLMEGQSGMWWGLILSLCAAAPSVGMSYAEIGGGLATGFLVSGVATALIGLFNLTSYLQKWFNATVTSVYLLLLSVQLIMIFFQGMIKVKEDGHLDIPVTLFSIFIVILVTLLSMKGRGAISNFAILIGIVVGWILYTYLFPAEQLFHNISGPIMVLFPWGKPTLEIGIIITTFVAALLNTINTLGSIDAAEKLFATQTSSKQYRCSFALTGFYTGASAVLGLVPYSPFASSVGFIEATRIVERTPFVIGAVLFSALGIVPAFGTFFSKLPLTVGNAVLFVAYLQLFGTALKRIQHVPLNSKTVYRYAIPFLTGICLMNLSPALIADLPVYLRPLISNGLLMGVLLSVILERAVDWSNYEEKREPGGEERDLHEQGRFRQGHQQAGMGQDGVAQR